MGEKLVPNSLSAEKRVRQNVRHRARNRWRKGQAKDAVKALEDAIQTGDAAKAAEQLRAFYKTIDQVAAQGTIHKNSASRKKARLAKRVAKMSAAKSV